tara:strand:+ start:116 stop:463 length:348 start_codon:yes stop_codon:yes gene_type:complete
MKKLLVGLTLLSSISSSYAYDCDTELAKNTESTRQIVEMVNVSESERGLMLEISSNARKSIELACGLRKTKKVDPLADIEKSRQEILEMDGISDTERSIMLEINSNAKKAVEMSL